MLFTSFGDNIKEVDNNFTIPLFTIQRSDWRFWIRWNAFDQLVLNTIKTVKLFSDKTERTCWGLVYWIW